MAEVKIITQRKTRTAPLAVATALVLTLAHLYKRLNIKMAITIVPSKTLRLIVAGCNALAWLSSAIVVGITGYFLNEYPHDQHLIFEMVIVSFSLPGAAILYH